ncbi:hypothetical protein ABZP36_006560 [Zizania latifolia]
MTLVLFTILINLVNKMHITKVLGRDFVICVLLQGGWENDETVEQAAAREAVEEAGVRGDIVQFLGFYDFKSKTLQYACCPEGMCRAAVFALHVKEELASWPEQSTRRRTWLTVSEATSQCRYQWMQEALLTGFSDWHDNWSKGSGDA